ncbi:MAG: hypothetical protein H0S82_00880 [Anaerolineaceae bacterium]|nr:hypothetical protein [Anaerolineaceae bacterium]
MTENTEQAFFTKKHARLANIAQLAKVIAWIYLVASLVNAATQIVQNTDYYLSQITYQYQITGVYTLTADQIYNLLEFINATIRTLLSPIIYWLVLMAISAGLKMILETDLNYRGSAEEGEEPAEGGKPKAMRAIVTETARVLKGTFHKKPTDPAAEENPSLKYTEGNQPVFYKPKQILSLDKWLEIAAVVSIARYILNFALIVIPNQYYSASVFGDGTAKDILAWIGTILYSLLNLGVQFLFIFFTMIVLGALLKVLMEMEFNSRGVEE